MTFLLKFVLLDLLVLVLSSFMAISIKNSFEYFVFNSDDLLLVFAAAALQTGSLCLFGVYRSILQYSGIKDLLNIFIAVTFGTFLMFALTLLAFPSYWKFVFPLWGISLFFLGGIRLARRLFWDFKRQAGFHRQGKKALIIGAGEAGALIARTLQSTKTSTGLSPVGFIDDDRRKKGFKLYGLPVLGTRDDIPAVVKKLTIEEAVIAIPSALPEQVKAIAAICRQAGIRVKVLPSVLDIIQGKNLLDQVQELQMEDLLHRSEVEINLDQVSGYLKNQVVIVTGAGGSIGAELCRQICSFRPEKLLLLGRGENSIYEINLQLERIYPEVEKIPIIADVRDEEKILEIFRQYRPGVVFHAAAHKHITFMEMYPEEAFKNNVFGTLNVARASDLYKAGYFIFISTDKAVKPSSAMGLTKLIAEMITRKFAMGSDTRYVSVRFGNVLGSRGSVVELFRRQIAAGGPLTVTHPDMRRFFMTIREAVQLVIQAGAMARGGEVFLLDMGEQIRIEELALDMIKLSNLCPGDDIEIKFVGQRPGEKLYEELLTEKEKAVVTQHQKIFMVENSTVDYELIEKIMSKKGFPAHEQIAEIMQDSYKKFNLPGRNKQDVEGAGNA